VLWIPPALSAQGPRIYPDRLYVGDNVVTITFNAGIESIRATPSRNTSVVIPTIRSCPRTVNINVRLADPSVHERVDILVSGCGGSLHTLQLTTEDWTIRHENTGPVEVGRDTCLVCEIVTPNEKIVDSIVVRDPRFRVTMPPGPGPWRVPPSVGGGPSINYRVCYTPSGTEVIDRMILLYIRRDQPNGGLEQYVIEKPITALGVPVPQPPVRTRSDSLRELQLSLPPVVDPTTFRTVLAPSAETLEEGHAFAGVFDVAGLLAGYGLTDDITLIGGGAFVPSFIEQLSALTVGGKWRFLSRGQWQASLGCQLAMSSSAESDIRLVAPFGVLSYGGRRSRISAAIGYSLKHHAQADGAEYGREAIVFTIGGDVTIGRGWKLSTEAYLIESSGIAPLTVAARWFNDRMAVDVGLIADLAGGNDIVSTGGLTGEIRDLRVVPLVTVLWRFAADR